MYNNNTNNNVSKHKKDSISVSSVKNPTYDTYKQDKIMNSERGIITPSQYPESDISSETGSKISITGQEPASGGKAGNLL